MTKEMLKDMKRRPERMVSREMIENLARINDSLNYYLLRIKDRPLLVSHPKGMRAIDNALVLCEKIGSVCNSKISVTDKIRIINGIIERASDKEATVGNGSEYNQLLNNLRGAIEKIEYENIKRKEEIVFLQEELIKSMEGKSELYFINLLNSPVSALGKEWYSKVKKLPPALVNSRSVDMQKMKVFDYFRLKLEMYRESSLLKEVKYFLHIISRREIRFLESVKSKESLMKFYMNPVEFIENIKKRIVEEGMTKDARFMEKLERIRQKAENISVEHIGFLGHALAELQRNLQPTEEMKTNTLSDINWRIQEIKRTIREVFTRYHDKRTVQLISKSRILKHFLRYPDEIMELTKILTNIPGADKYAERLPPELMRMINQSKDYEKEWQTFEKFYKSLKRGRKRSYMVEKFGDEESYKIFLSVKEQFHMWPEKWAEVISERINRLLKPETIRGIISQIRGEFERIINLRRRELETELRYLASQLIEAADDKIRNLAKESEEAYEELEKRVKKRISELLKPAEEKIKNIAELAREFKERRANYWDSVSEEFKKAGDNFTNGMKSFEEMYRFVMSTMPKPELIGYKIIRNKQKKIRILEDVTKAFSWLEKASENGFYRVDEFSWLKSLLPRLRKGDALNEWEWMAAQSFKKAFTGNGYDIFNRIYITGWQALKEAHSIWQALEVLGINKKAEAIERKWGSISRWLGILKEKEEKGISVLKGFTNNQYRSPPEEGSSIKIAA